MSISIDLEKIDYKKFVNKLLENKEIKDKEMLEKIILEFGNKIGNDLVILGNEYYEDGHCIWNMLDLINKYFNLTDEDFSSDVYHELRKRLIDYKEIDEACENIGIELLE